jgi:hypothetical protein
MIQPCAARCRDAADQVAGWRDLDSGPDAMAGHRLVIEARDDMQVRVEPALIIPAERVAVGTMTPENVTRPTIWSERAGPIAHPPEQGNAPRVE